MKTFAIHKSKYSGEYWNFKEVDYGKTTDFEWFFSKNIRFILGNSAYSERINFYSESLLRVGSQIKNIFDSKNNQVQPGTFWSITSIEPMLDSFNQINGYKYKAIRQVEGQ